MQKHLRAGWFLVAGIAAAVGLAQVRAPKAESACCYFSAKDKDVNQPAQKAFLTWDPQENVETFTVQPKFEGNATDFGMVVPTPSQPKLHEMPREFFKELAVFTILEPMDLTKYKRQLWLSSFSVGMPAAAGSKRMAVKVLEAGIVGSLDYKIIQAERADGLYTWLKDNKYSYAGDQATLDYYIKRKWFFSVMKIDPMQMKKKPDGTFEGEITPTRFNFASEKLVYPLKITQISVKVKTEALFYIQAPSKMDLPGGASYQFSFVPMWSNATSFAIPEKLTQEEVAWQSFVRPKLSDFNQREQEMRRNQRQPATLEWAKRLRPHDMAVLEGKERYNRDAPAEDVGKLKLLRGHVKEGQFITKIRKVFTKPEMEDDLELVRARVGEREDNMEYFAILPTSPP
jgi:hypothetical protein